MRGDRWRLVLSFAVTVAGLLVVPLVVAYPTWTAVPWLIVGLAAGAVAGRASAVWVSWLGTEIGVTLVLALREVSLTGRLLPFGVAISVALVGLLVSLGFVGGSVLSTRAATLPRLRADWRALPRPGRALAALVVAADLVFIAGFTIYVGTQGADVWSAGGQNPDCRTPQIYGWTYEAINYDQADDATLEGTAACKSQGAAAGDAVVTSDGFHIAGWYIPAGSNPDPTGATVVIIPGANSDKSAMLAYGQPLHAKFNLLLLDDRGNGRSLPGKITLGLYEQRDVEAMIDWLEREKHPTWVAALGDSLGAQTALAAAVDDKRIRALVLDSMHAHAVTAAGRILETEWGLPALPAAVAIIGVSSFRLDGDIPAFDPVETMSRLHSTPVLLIHGTGDVIDVPALSLDLVVHAAQTAGVPLQVEYCENGTHGELVDDPKCSAAWSQWVNQFFADSVAGSPPGS